SVAGNAAVPPGPEVGEVEDGTLPGAAGELRYRLYRPATDGPHAVIAYFHGGGWVLGSHESDDPFCRDLCVRSNAVVISVDYRHAPEARFPAAAEDGFAAVTWIAEHAGELGGIPGQLSVAGWSAGANVATVASHLARDAGGPAISAQLLVNPVVDADMGRASYVENAEGYLLTAGLMQWFWDHYTDEPQRSDPLASPLRADNLGDLPPAVVVTSEFDPLRDEGVAYAEALEKSGTTVRHIAARGHIHTSLTAVGVVPSGAEYRAEMVEALQEISSPS
ncbi:MAG: alpha/beta hydrolase, partial [Actinobacteria bacterium]|nr:alpha/beta hydrolase [Actinomycetota bacterium]